jgi:hypothetical protein
VALARSDLAPSVTKQAQSEGIELLGSHDTLSSDETDQIF